MANKEIKQNWLYIFATQQAKWVKLSSVAYKNIVLHQTVVLLVPTKTEVVHSFIFFEINLCHTASSLYKSYIKFICGEKIGSYLRINIVLEVLKEFPTEGKRLKTCTPELWVKLGATQYYRTISCVLRLMYVVL